MLIKASQRGGARNLANHLASTRDNDHVTLTEVRGLCGQSLHAALLEIEAVSFGTNCQQPLFSVSFNPPPTENVSQSAFNDAFDKLEQKMGLEGQARVVVYHEKKGRRHAHVVWSRIDVDEMKSIRMSHFKTKCKDLSRDLYIQHGWDMPKGLINKRERDPFQVSTAEWHFLKRNGVDPKQIKQLCQNAWQKSESLISFRQELEERGLFLAKGNKRGFVVLNEAGKVFSLSRVGCIKSKELKLRLGSPDQLDSVDQLQQKIRIEFNSRVRETIREFEAGQQAKMQELEDRKSQLIHTQRAERLELANQQQIQRNILIESGRAKYRRGLRGIFDKITGREKFIRLINREELHQLMIGQSEVRLQMIFQHLRNRNQLQQIISERKDRQMQERVVLARKLCEIRRATKKELKKKTKTQFNHRTEKITQKKSQEPVVALAPTENEVILLPKYLSFLKV